LTIASPLPARTYASWERAEALELDQWLWMVLDAQRDLSLPGVAVGRHYENRRGLATADVSPGLLAGVQRREQAVTEWAGGRRERADHRSPDRRIGHDVRLARDTVREEVAGVGHALVPGVGRGAAGAVDDRHLPSSRAGVGRDQADQRGRRLADVPLA
jgi:hypothetical protein